jgi:hypothetical protein
MLKDTQKDGKKQESREKSAELAQHCAEFLLPLLGRLNEHVDRRIVKTLLDLVLIIVIHRHRNQALILSELGGELLGEAHAPAGTKRISNLLHSKQWQAAEIKEELWRQGDERVAQLHAAQEEALVIWDESENEKPESIAAEGLCAVRSSKAARLKRIKPGFYNPPGGRPIFVPGFHWLQILVVGLQGAPCLTHLHWWTSRGEQASDKRSEERSILTRLAQHWAERVIHVFDQGFAGAPWVQELLTEPRLRFVLRWKKGYKLLGLDGQAKLAWQLARGKRSMGHKELWDARRRCRFKAGVVFLSVQLPDIDHPFWLVVCRPGSGRKPCYLLTNLPVNCVEDAWHIVFIYARRWQVEMALRFDKTELGFESPRVHAWETRMRFLGIAALAHAFLLLLLAPHFDKLKHWLLDQWCHRNGKWSRETPTPLYRLRLALSQLWRALRPPYLPLLDSG